MSAKAFIGTNVLIYATISIPLPKGVLQQLLSDHCD